MDLKENILKRKGCQIHYWTSIKPGAPLLVFTHGAFIDHREWDATLPLAVQSGYSVLAWDLREHGKSRPGVITLQEALDDMLAVLDAVGARQSTFIGHSMGGNLSQELVFQHPDRVFALVCVDCTWNFQKLTQMDKLLLKIGIPMLNLYPYPTLIKQMADVSAEKPASRAYLREAFNQLSKPEFAHVMGEAALCLHYEPDFRIQKPLLLILGEKDQTGNIKKVMPIWAKHEPDCEFHIVPGAQHAVNLDEPDAFHALLFDFLKRRIPVKV